MRRFGLRLLIIFTISPFASFATPPEEEAKSEKITQESKKPIEETQRKKHEEKTEKESDADEEKKVDCEKTKQEDKKLSKEKKPQDQNKNEGTEDKDKDKDKKDKDNDKSEKKKEPKPEKILKEGNLAFPVSQQPTPLISSWPKPDRGRASRISVLCRRTQRKKSIFN